MPSVSLAFTRRYITLTVAVIVAALTLPFAAAEPGALVLLLVALLLVAVGVHDLLQRRHAILRNYPIVGHIRFLLEEIRPEIRQYFWRATPTASRSTATAALVYQRAKGEHRQAAVRHPARRQRGGYRVAEPFDRAADRCRRSDLRITIGGRIARSPISASIFNISAMSFGALSANAIRALNRGAKLGGFATTPARAAFSPTTARGGDIVWQLGTGYFGCRDEDGDFDPSAFAEQAARSPGQDDRDQASARAPSPATAACCPAAKVTAEIAAHARRADGRGLRLAGAPLGLLDADRS